MPNCTCTSFMSSAILQILSTNKYPQLQRKMLWNKEKINCICLKRTGTNLRLINTCYLSTGPPPLSMSRYWVHHHWVVVPLFLSTMEGRDHLHYSLIQILQTFCIHQGVMVGFATSQSMLCSALCIFVKLWNNSWSWICKIVFHHQPLNNFKHLCKATFKYKRYFAKRGLLFWLIIWKPKFKWKRLLDNRGQLCHLI